MSEQPTTTSAPADLSAVQEAVTTQVEFYLSSSNLPFDKFLFNLWARSHQDPAAVIASTPAPSDDAPTTTTSNKKLNPFHVGWLPLEKICSFKRMQPYSSPPPTGLGSIDSIAETVRERSTQLEVKRFGTESDAGYGWYVRRTSALKKPEDAMQRSVYAKGFPATTNEGETDEEKQQVRDDEHELQKKLEQWARSLGVGKVLSLRMRREDKQGQEGKAPLKGRGKFKGSIFVEFEDKQSVDKFLALDPKPTYEGTPLETKAKAVYVEEKRQLYAPDSKPIESNPNAIPKNPYAKNKNSGKPFNAWAERLISDDGVPSVPSAASARLAKDGGDDKKQQKKRKAEDDNSSSEPQEREIQYDGVRYKARKGPNGGEVEIVDEETVGTGSDGWKMGKLLRFTIVSDKKEAGEKFNYGEFKRRLEPIAKPAFVGLQQETPRSQPADNKKDDSKNEFPTKLKAPPMVVASTEVTKKEEVEIKDGQQEYPAKGQASFKDVVTDEQFEQLKQQVSEVNGRKVEWVRAPESDERSHQISRARFHAEQAFGGNDDHHRGGGGGRGGGRGGRGGRGGGGGRGRGGDFKRQRRD